MTEVPHRFRVRPFHPAWWAPGPHRQTIAGKYLRQTVSVRLERERWNTPDGDFLDLDFTEEPAHAAAARDAPAPLVVVLHGLEGGSRRAYALLAYHELARRGARAVGLNFRSCSGEPNRLPRSYHSGETGDLAFVLARLMERFPERPIGALGFSLGGNVLLKFLGERGAGAPLAAAAAVSVPYDLAAGALSLEVSPMGRVYGWHFLRSLRRKVLGKAALLRESLPMDRVAAARTVREFDDVATAPLHGFRNAAHYYAECSSAGFLSRIAKPTLLLHARDDPFQPERVLPLRAMRDNPALVSGVVERGGHVGFVEGSPARPTFWAEPEAARFLAGALGAHDER
jgi:predicted alpha/beta-fold hydrolase